MDTIRAGYHRCHYFQKQTIEKWQRNASWGKRLGGNDDVVSILQSTVFPPEIEWVIEWLVVFLKMIGKDSIMD